MPLVLVLLVSSCSYTIAALPGPGPCSRAPAVIDAGYAIALGVLALPVARTTAVDEPARHDDDDGSWVALAKLALPALIAGAVTFAVSAHHGETAAAGC